MTIPRTTDPHALYQLLTWLSPACPVGAYTCSHGLEYAIEAGLVRNAASLHRWIEGLLLFGSARVEADLFREMHMAVSAADPARFTRVLVWSNALRGSAEMAEESSSQGRALQAVLDSAWPHPDWTLWRQRWQAEGHPPGYGPTVALAAAVHAIDLSAALTAFLHAFAANLISAALRLVPLGQSDGQRVQAALLPTVIAATTAALARDWAALGAAAPMADWASMAHETQYTRLFRT